MNVNVNDDEHCSLLISHNAREVKQNRRVLTAATSHHVSFNATATAATTAATTPTCTILRILARTSQLSLSTPLFTTTTHGTTTSVSSSSWTSTLFCHKLNEPCYRISFAATLSHYCSVICISSISSFATLAYVSTR